MANRNYNLMRQGTMGENVALPTAPSTPVSQRATSRPLTPPTLIIKRDPEGNDVYGRTGDPIYTNEQEVNAAYAAYNMRENSIRSAYKMKLIEVNIYNIHKQLVYDPNRNDMPLFYLVQLDPANPEDVELFKTWEENPSNSHLVDRSGNPFGSGLFGSSQSSSNSSGATDQSGSSGSLDSMYGGSLGLSKLLTGTKRVRRGTKRRGTKRRGNNKARRSKKTRR
jgi:hypothetical protein